MGSLKNYFLTSKPRNQRVKKMKLLKFGLLAAAVFAVAHAEEEFDEDVGEVDVEAELAGGRSYGLQLNLHYMNDAPQPQVFTEAFYNSTVEVAENMDNAIAEQMFMLLTLVVVGGLVFAYFAAKVSPKKAAKAAAAVVVETGTGDAADVSWIPKEHQKKSGSATASPTARRRKAD